jgi:hypothetical protein
VHSAASTPGEALRDLSELTGELHAAIVLGPDGSSLAVTPDRGDLAERLRDLSLAVLERADAAGGDSPAEVEVTTPSGAVHVLRHRGFVLAVAAGRVTLSSLMRYDMRRTLAGLAR